MQAGQNETLETILKYANLSVSNTDGNYSVNDAKVEGSPSGVRVSNGIVYAIQ